MGKFYATSPSLLHKGNTLLAEICFAISEIASCISASTPQAVVMTLNCVSLPDAPLVFKNLAFFTKYCVTNIIDTLIVKRYEHATESECQILACLCSLNIAYIWITYICNIYLVYVNCYLWTFSIHETMATEIKMPMPVLFYSLCTNLKIIRMLLQL